MRVNDGQLSLFDQPEGITEDEITKCLHVGSGFELGTGRIWEQFNRCHDRKANAEFLKKEYGTGGMWPAYAADHEKELAIDYDSRGIRIRRIADWDENTQLPWDAVERRVREMFDAGEYLEAGHERRI